MTTEKDTARAEEQARAQLDSIVAMVKRLEHCQDCDGDDCELTDQEIYEGLNLYWKEGDKATDEEREGYHDEEQAREAVEGDPLSIQVRSDWHSLGEESEDEEYEILLCTGGPACRIVGDIEHGQPYRARLEYQDWFTPWIEYLNMTHTEHEALLTYAQQFYFGH